MELAECSVAASSAADSAGRSTRLTAAEFSVDLETAGLKLSETKCFSGDYVY